MGDVTPLDDVVSDFGSAVVFWWVPVELAGVAGDLRHLQGSGWRSWQPGDVDHEGLFGEAGVVGHLDGVLASETVLGDLSHEEDEELVEDGHLEVGVLLHGLAVAEQLHGERHVARPLDLMKHGKRTD